ncbi:hypothetical protein L1887_53223 [Cichorium endivia]|nr:hypothetical protein L1887_53223 [Cichorium endivia]
MASRAASLAQRAQLRSSPLLALRPRPASSIVPSSSRYASAPRSFSVAASPSRSSLYSSAASSRSSIALAAGTRLAAVGAAPFVAPIAHRNLSLWPFSKSSTQQAETTPFVSEVEQKKGQAVEAASEAKQVTEQSLHDASASVADGVQSAQDGASDAAASLKEKASELAHDVQEQLSQIDTTALSTATESLGGAMGVKAGELSELGLTNWFSPPGFLTNMLDIVGTTTGLPWWGTIMVTTVALRVLIAPVNVGGQKNAIRLGNIQPQMKRNMDDIKHFKAAGDQMQMQKAVMDTQKLLRDNNANPLGSLIPLAVQLPLMFSFYLALSRLATSGSETFAHGGPFWALDLTSPDPTWILPAVSTAATFAVAELGFRFGTTGQADPGQTQMMKYIFRGMMPVLGYFSTTFPAGVLVYWATTNVFSVVQLLVLQVPVVRQWAKFPKRIQHPKNPYAEDKAGFMGKLRAARDQLTDSKPATVKTVERAPSSANARNQALREILDDKAAYDAEPKSAAADAEAKEAKRNRDRVLKARQRRARQ